MSSPTHPSSSSLPRPPARRPERLIFQIIQRPWSEGSERTNLGETLRKPLTEGRTDRSLCRVEPAGQGKWFQERPWKPQVRRLCRRGSPGKESVSWNREQ